MVHSEIAAAVAKFRRLYGIPPNMITVGSNVAHELRHIAKHTMLYKPIKFDKLGKMTLNNISVDVDYEYPDMIEISLKMKVRRRSNDSFKT